MRKKGYPTRPPVSCIDISHVAEKTTLFDEKRFKKEYPAERTLCFKEHGDWEIWDMEPADVINLLIERLALSSREG